MRMTDGEYMAIGCPQLEVLFELVGQTMYEEDISFNDCPDFQQDILVLERVNKYLDKLCSLSSEYIHIPMNIEKVLDEIIDYAHHAVYTTGYREHGVIYINVLNPTTLLLMFNGDITYDDHPAFF